MIAHSRFQNEGTRYEPSKNSLRRPTWAAVASCGLTVVFVSRSPTDRPRPPRRVDPVAAARQAAEARYVSLVGRLRTFFAQTRDADLLREVVFELTSLGEKLNLGTDLVGNTDTQARLRNLFRQTHFDDQKLLHALHQEWKTFQRQLIDEDIELFVEAGYDRAAITKALEQRVPPRPEWNTAFEPLWGKLVEISQSDAARFAGTMAGSALAAEGAIEAGRAVGLVNTQEGSFEDAALGWLADLVIGLAVDWATDPTESWVESLAEELRQCEARLLLGKTGFLTQLRQLTDAHLELREHYLVR